VEYSKTAQKAYVSLRTEFVMTIAQAMESAYGQMFTPATFYRVVCSVISPAFLLVNAILRILGCLVRGTKQNLKKQYHNDVPLSIRSFCIYQ